MNSFSRVNLKKSDEEFDDHLVLVKILELSLAEKLEGILVFHFDEDLKTLSRLVIKLVESMQNV